MSVEHAVNRRPCYSTRLLAPFVRVLARYEQIPRDALSRLGRVGEDERIPITKANALLESAVRLTGDEDLGLRAGKLLTLGDCAALDYVMNTAGTVREAIDIAGRYMRLVNDDLTVRLDTEGQKAILGLGCEGFKLRAVADFQLSALFAVHVRRWLSPDTPFECWLSHAQPEDLAAYRDTFGALAVFRFTAPHYGFAFGKDLLDRPLPDADPKLNEVLRQYTQIMWSALPTAQSFADQVRTLLLRELLRGRPDAPHVASRLRMSVRTLSRKLESEGTNFKEVLESLRRQLALHHLARSDLSISEIAYVLGYSQVATFHRAFRRWTDQSPREYRVAVRAYRQPIPAEAQHLSLDETMLFPKSMLERTG